MRPLQIIAIGGALLSASAVVALAQIPAPPPGRTYAFEVASVKPSAPEERLRVFDFKPTGSLTVRNQTLRKLIAAAYGTPFPIPLPDERIVGGPEWLGTARFAVEARSALPPDGATAARDIGFMLRTLLADRFGLRVRLEPRPQRVYALVRAPGKPQRPRHAPSLGGGLPERALWHRRRRRSDGTAGRAGRSAWCSRWRKPWDVRS